MMQEHRKQPSEREGRSHLEKRITLFAHVEMFLKN
jgi:hypothetical protein